MTLVEPFPVLSLDEAGLLLAEAIMRMGLFEEACVEDRAPSAPLPRGLMTSGDACRLLSAVVGLAYNLYPQLFVAGVLENILRDAMMSKPIGGMQ